MKKKKKKGGKIPLKATTFAISNTQELNLPGIDHLLCGLSTHLSKRKGLILLHTTMLFHKITTFLHNFSYLGTAIIQGLFLKNITGRLALESWFENKHICIKGYVTSSYFPANKRRIHPYVRDVFTFYDLFSFFFGIAICKTIGRRVKSCRDGQAEGNKQRSKGE